MNDLETKFRGHETFYIRKGWLYKGLKNIAQNPKVFTDKNYILIMRKSKRSERISVE